MKQANNLLRRSLSMLLAGITVFSMVSAAFAHDAEDGTDTEHDETPYSISIYTDKEPNQNGTLTYTVTSHEDGTVSEVYDASNTDVTAVAGDTITLYAAPSKGYTLSSIGYCKAERIEQAFNIKTVDAQSDGSYTFTMPAYDIYIGAAFYGENEYYILKEAGTSNSVANIDPLHILELGLNHAWLHQNAETVSIDMHLDKRILTFEETSGKTMTFRFEIREVGDSGFVLKGSQEYTTAELQQLINEKSTSTETDEKGREYYVLRDVAIPVDADADFTLDKEVYCTAMFTLEGWTNAIGAPYYRWGYSGGDRAYILENDTAIPTSMVYLYNLEPETYHGALVAEAIDRVEEEMGITIETRYFTSENMTERIGYLAEWPGYESYGDTEPSTKTYKKKIVLYCSLPSMVRDKLGDYIRETGVTNLLSSKLTAYGASKSFEEFYKNQETESEVFTAALALSLLAYEAHNAVPESEYGSHPLWAEFKAVYDECIAIINTTAEQEASVYTEARLKLLDVYLRIIGKTQLTTEFTFIIEEHDAENYKITVDTSKFPEDLEVTYRWYDASTKDHLIIPKDQLYKVKCTVKAAENGPYYGFKEISLATPTELVYDITADSSSICVAFTKYESQNNTPEPITYTAELYLNETLVETRSNDTAEAVTFSDLESNTTYSVRIYAYNIVGRTTYMTETVNTDVAPAVPEEPETPDQPESPVTFANPFTDVIEGRFYYEPVLWAAGNGITNGTSATTFAPDAACTRAQMVTFLWRAVGTPDATVTGTQFTDVNPSAYYYDALLWAAENGITNGISATTFAPDAACPRAQMVTFLWRAVEEPAAPVSNTNFTDINPSAYYYNALLWAVENDITNGVDRTTFAPDTACTRGQMVTFLYRCYAG